MIDEDWYKYTELSSTLHYCWLWGWERENMSSIWSLADSQQKLEAWNHKVLNKQNGWTSPTFRGLEFLDQSASLISPRVWPQENLPNFAAHTDRSKSWQEPLSCDDSPLLKGQVSLVSRNMALHSNNNSWPYREAVTASPLIPNPLFSPFYKVTNIQFLLFFPRIQCF